MSVFGQFGAQTLCRIRGAETADITLGAELFATLSQLLPVRFVRGDRNESELAADIFLGCSDESHTSIASKATSSLSIASANVNSDDGEQLVDVKFSASADVPFPFRGRIVTTKTGRVVPSLSLRDNEDVLAASERGAIWAVSRTGTARHFRSALPLPAISPRQNLSDVFNGERFMDLLPFLTFLREISCLKTYRTPPVRACFIIDDPNLHWPSYGFVDYRQIADHAQKGNYHVAFATIPVDTWFTHTLTADIFRGNQRWLSLSVHGNNHAKNELAREYSHTMRKELLRQAIWRIERLERKANLRVSRVMVPPHGACSSEMLIDLPSCGFGAACISAGSLRAHNQDKPWTKTLGFFPSEVIEGCPVLPRWGLTNSARNTVLVAAYLGQPIILRGHHQDLRDGPGILDDLAGFINDLGRVHWSNLSDLSRLNYLWRMEGSTCHMKPLGLNIDFELPSEARHLVIDPLRSADQHAWKIISSDGRINDARSSQQVRLPEGIAKRIAIERVNSLTAHEGAPTQTSVALVLRRLLTETRDRLAIY